MARELRLLVADDSADDIFLLQRAFGKAGIDVAMTLVNDGQEAIDYLEGKGLFGDRQRHPMPSMLVLDLKMPGLGGFEVLEWLRGQEALRRMPVLILTTSELPVDINRAYDLGANTYMVKPIGNDELLRLAEGVKRYWLEKNVFPDAESG